MAGLLEHVWRGFVAALFFTIATGAAAAPSNEPTDDRPYVFTQILKANPFLSVESVSGSEQLRKEAAGGDVRVFIGLGFPTVDEDSLAPAAAARQAQSLAAAEQAMLSRTIHLATARHQLIVYDTIPFVAVTVTADELDRILRDPMVYWVGKVGMSPPAAATWNIAKIEVQKIWTAGYDGTGYVIAVLDTGAQENHPMLAGKVVEEMCFSKQDLTQNIHTLCPNHTSQQFGPGAAKDCPISLRPCWHGTHVASIAAGKLWNGLQGVAPGAKLILAQVFSKGFLEDGSAFIGASDDQEILALNRIYGMRSKYKIAAINASLGNGGYAAPCDATNEAYEAILKKLRVAKIPTFFSAGNEFLANKINFPACLSSAIAVGATDAKEQVAGFSNHSKLVSLMAPGVGIDAAVPTSYHGVYSGTSQASPAAAGAFTVLRSARPQASVDDILRALACTGQAVYRNGIFKRRIDVAQAFDVLKYPPNQPRVFDFNKAADAAAWTTVNGKWTMTGGKFVPTFTTAHPYSTAVTTNCDKDLDAEMVFSVQPAPNGSHYHFAIFPRALYTITSTACHVFSGYEVMLDLYAETGPLGAYDSSVYSIYIYKLGQYSPSCNPAGTGVTLLMTKAKILDHPISRLKVETRGARILVFVDGSNVASVTDTTYTTGSMSMLVYSEDLHKAAVDKFTITPEDQTVAAAPADPAAFGGAFNSPAMALAGLSAANP